VAKLRLVVDSVTFDPETTPMPLKATDWGLFGALSVIVTLAVRGPI
jgi:hypothetical protein